MCGVRRERGSIQAHHTSGSHQVFVSFDFARIHSMSPAWPRIDLNICLFLSSKKEKKNNSS